MLPSIAQELTPSTHSITAISSALCFKPNPNFSFFLMRTSPYSAFTFLRSLTLSLSNAHHHHHRRCHRLISSFTLSPPTVVNSRQLTRLSDAPAASSTSVEQLASKTTSSEEELRDYVTGSENEAFDFDKSSAASDLKHLRTPKLEVKDLNDLPEQWRRARLAWLCKELPSHKAGTLVRILNAQKKWMRQDDATYVAVHCMRIRENETCFRVYKWMMQQHWYRLDFALATKLADYRVRSGSFQSAVRYLMIYSIRAVCLVNRHFIY